MQILPNSAPGPDGITASVIKIIHKVSPQDLLEIVNHSVRNAWIPPDWRIAKIIPLLKKQGSGYTLDNIRPISLTSNLVKLIERILHIRIDNWLNEHMILSPCQIGFRRGCSIWCAHVDLESRIQLARDQKYFAALVTLDIAKAYDSVEHVKLINSLTYVGLPNYFVAWVHSFLKDRKFYCSQSGISSLNYKQTRGLPQGSVLSPLLFNILLSTIPIQQGVQVYVYADDIAFFATAADIHTLYQNLQMYMNTLETWLEGINLSLNIRKSAIVIFPLSVPVQISLLYRQDVIPQVESIKYLGVIYTEKLNWGPHIETMAAKGARAVGMLRRLSNKRTGLRRDVLLMIYCMYIRPILEFGCVLFSGAPAYKLRPLVLLERESLRLCLGLPKFVANNILYKEARLPSLLTRFHILTVRTFLKIYASPLRRSQYVFINQPMSFFNHQWSILRCPQVIFAQKLLTTLQVNLREVLVSNRSVHPIKIQFDDIFPKKCKDLPNRYIKAILEDHLSKLDTNIVIATDASVYEEKAGVGITSLSLDWSFSIRLPDFTPIYQAELLAIILALRKLPLSITEVVILTDCLSVCSSLTAPNMSCTLEVFYSLVPRHLRFIRLVWVPGHKGLTLNECADALAVASRDGPVISILPTLSFVSSARFEKFATSVDIGKSPLSTSEFLHLDFSWKNRWCSSRRAEISITRLRCRVPPLNFYLHRSGLSQTHLCHHCNESESLHHFFITCRLYKNQRKRLLEEPLRRMGLNLSLPMVLSFGAIELGHSHRNVFEAVCDFLRETKRIAY